MKTTESKCRILTSALRDVVRQLEWLNTPENSWAAKSTILVLNRAKLALREAAMPPLPGNTLTLNTIIRLPDGRIGTICYHSLDGDGGVWGVHRFVMPDTGFGDELPAPLFMLREKSIESLLYNRGHIPEMECVGTEFEIVTEEPQEEI